MKALSRILPLLLLLSLVACASPKMVAYKSLAAIGYSVDASMQIHANLVARGLETPATRAKVAYMHDKQFNPAYTAAVMAAKLDLTAPAPCELQTIAANLSAFISSLVGTNKVSTP